MKLAVSFFWAPRLLGFSGFWAFWFFRPVGFLNLLAF